MEWWSLVFLHYVAENFSKLDTDSLIQVLQNYDVFFSEEKDSEMKIQTDEDITDKIIVFILFVAYVYFVILNQLLKWHL